jgi:hypothetical protein
MPARLSFEVVQTPAGACVTPAAFAEAVGVPMIDVVIIMSSWPPRTLARCVYDVGGAPYRLTERGVRLLLDLLAIDEAVEHAILRRMDAADPDRH